MIISISYDIILQSGGQDVPQVSAFFLPQLVLLSAISSYPSMFSIFIRQHNKTIATVIHSIFIVYVLDAVKLLLFLVFSFFHNDPPEPRKFLLVFILFVLVDSAATPHYLFLVCVDAEEAILIVLDLPELPHSAGTVHLR